MKIEIEIRPSNIGVGIPNKMMAYAPIECWRDHPIKELIRTLHLLGFELDIEQYDED